MHLPEFAHRMLDDLDRNYERRPSWRYMFVSPSVAFNNLVNYAGEAEGIFAY